jgi:hypothetical protein
MLALASKESNFRASQSIGAMASPEDRALYRELLPQQFGMPSEPLVWVCIIDNIEVGPWPLTRYQLGFISLYCTYKGEEGWHPITMPENKWVPVWAGRTMGFPKYVADHVSLTSTGDSWRGEVAHKGASRLSLEFSPDRTDPPLWVREERHPEERPTFNLKPPSKGPRVVAVRGVVTEGAKPELDLTEGTVVVTIGPDEPGAGLLKPETALYGTYVMARGTDVSLQPESSA